MKSVQVPKPTSAPTSDISRPSVVVKVPEIRLRLEDLAYLRSVGQPKSVRCQVTRNVLDRLRFLDLIARAKVGPSSELKESIDKEYENHKRNLMKAIDKEDWDAAYIIVNSLQRNRISLEPWEDDVLTERGKQLLKQGEVKVKVRKVGCV